ncbi:uncharacterized protein LOC123489281 [Coregonus clupeaformis]|uniref:uncharacterized protein LOC123489281 n=1 Tax=Coregonus clupeaformis TaxID=59861 RepID=UPI001E1C718A|nr:uncharacterized protein LOC123489281 [Coregonus clupeaformis]
MSAGFLTTTQAAWAAPAQTLEEEVGGADVSEVSTSSLTPTEARQGLLGKIPSLLPGEILIEEDISFRSTPRDTVMSPQTLKLILQGIMRRLEASESPQARRANDPFRLMKNLFLEVQHALKYADISVLFSLEESIQFRGEDAMKAIVKAAAKRLSLRSDSNRAQLRAARYGGEGTVCCMADTIAHVIGDHAQDWSSDGHFGARRSLGSGRSRSSSSSSKSDITLTEELLAQGETLEEDQEEVAAIDDNKKCDSASLEKASSSSLSADLVDSTSTQKTVKDEAVKEGVRKSGEGKRGRKKTLKKNKVSPLGTDDTVADEPGKKTISPPEDYSCPGKTILLPLQKEERQKLVVWMTMLKIGALTAILEPGGSSDITLTKELLAERAKEADQDDVADDETGMTIPPPQKK